MKQFFTEAIKEFEHVAWPTNAETKKYFTIVVSMIVVMAVAFFLVSTFFSWGLMTGRSQVKESFPSLATPVSTPTTGSAATLPDLGKALNNLPTTPAKK